LQALTEIALGFGNIFHFPTHLVNVYDVRSPVRLHTGITGSSIIIPSKIPNVPHVVVKKFFDFSNVNLARLCHRELTILNKMKHENIVRFLIAYTDDTDEENVRTLYHITEYCGKSLRQVINDEDKIKMNDVKYIVTQMLRACKYLNSASVIYRDLKPDNIFCDDKGKLKLFDFGLARVIDRDANMTNQIGEFAYRPIETEPSWSSNYDEKVDMWSVGAILCELLTGEAVFGGDGKYLVQVPMMMCGPIEDDVLAMIGNDKMRQMLREKSKSVKRIDFVKYLLDEGRSWLKQEIASNNEYLRSFIDGTLQFDPDLRMTVDEALAHPFLAEFYDQSRNDCAGFQVEPEQLLPADEVQALEECKRRIWNEI
ncbi:hypothetical protein PFISCL1PPCAC_14083, partial [Pristionchus fissidentatus]